MTALQAYSLVCSPLLISLVLWVSYLHAKIAVLEKTVRFLSRNTIYKDKAMEETR